MLATAWNTVRAGAPQTRRPVLALYLTVNVAADEEQGRRELEQFISRYYNAPFEAIAKRQGCFSGSADALAERLRPFLETGVDHLVLRLGGGDPAVQFRRTASDLLPRLRELRPA